MNTNITTLHFHCKDEDNTTQIAPVDQSDFYLMHNTDRYVYALRRNSGNFTIIPWLLYKLDSTATTQFGSDIAMCEQTALVPITSGTDWKAYNIQYTGAYGIYFQITAGEGSIVVGENHTKTD